MFAERLKQRRLELGLTQDALATSIDKEKTRQMVSNWECGNSLPEVESLLVLAVQLDISLDELFADELSYIRKDKAPEDDFVRRYPGIVTGLKALAEALKNLDH